MNNYKKQYKKEFKPVSIAPVISEQKIEKEQIYSWKHLLFLFLLAFALYANTIPFGYTLDDPISTANNKYVAMGVKGIPTLFTKGYMYGINEVNQGAYRPMPLISFALEYQLIGENPSVNHLINVILYGIAVVLLFLMLKRLFENYHYYFAFVVTLLYIAHPIHTEVVASIKSRDEILTFLFLVLSMLLLLRYIDKNKISNLIGACIVFFMALLSKESAFTFLAVIPLTIFFFRNIPLKRLIILSLPFLALGGFYMFLRSVFLESVVSSESLDVINNTLYAAKTSAEKYATAFYILLKYIIVLILPHPLSWDYSFNKIPIIGLGNIKAIFAIIVYTGLAVYAFYKLRSKSIISYAILFFLVTISVVSNLLVDFGSTMGERFLFTPSIAFCILLALLLFKAFKIDFFTRIIKLSNTALAVFTILMVLYSGKTISRNMVWKNNMNLFTSGVETAPNSARTNFCLGYEYFVYGDKEKIEDKAAVWYRKAAMQMGEAIKIYPKYVDAHKHIGFMYYKLKEWDNAILFLKQSMRFNDSLPDANFYAGLSYGFKFKHDSAFYFIDKAIRLKKDYTEAFHYKGIIYSDYADKQIDADKKREYLNLAIDNFNKAIELNAEFGESYIQKGYNYGKLGEFDKVIEPLKYGIRLVPGNSEAVLYVGMAYALKGIPDSAIVYFKQSLIIKPDYVEGFRNLAITYKNLKEYPTSLKYINEGLKHAPNDGGLLSLKAEVEPLTKSANND